MDPTFNLMLDHSLEAGLRQAGVSNLFIEELAMAIMKVNYGQTPDAHQFVGRPSFYLIIKIKLNFY